MILYEMLVGEKRYNLSKLSQQELINDIKNK